MALKMPAPITAPIPRAVRLKTPRDRFNRCSERSASSWQASTSFRRNRELGMRSRTVLARAAGGTTTAVTGVDEAGLSPIDKAAMTSTPAPPDVARLEASVRAALDAAGARYEVMACDPAFADTAAFCERYGIDPTDSANAILVASRREPKIYALCLVLATTDRKSVV